MLLFSLHSFHKICAYIYTTSPFVFEMCAALVGVTLKFGSVQGNSFLLICAEQKCFNEGKMPLYFVCVFSEFCHSTNTKLYLLIYLKK